MVYCDGSVSITGHLSAAVDATVPPNRVRHNHSSCMTTRTSTGIFVAITQLLLHQTVAKTITRHSRSLVLHLDMQQPLEVPARKEVVSMTRQGVGAMLHPTKVDPTVLPDTTVLPATVDSTALVVTTIPPTILDTMPHHTPVVMTWDIICQLLI